MRARAEQERRRRNSLTQNLNTGTVYEFLANNAALQTNDAPELILEGPAQTGKTIATLTRLNALCWRVPGLQAVIVRKRQVDLQPTALQTYERKVLGATRNAGKLDGTPVTVYGGERAEFYQYPNGSRVWVGGLDNPGKTLSSERDLIYVNQCEELTLEDWETLTTRATGRAGNWKDAHGKSIGQVLGDMNPSGLAHWAYQREARGALLILQTRHKDNPQLYLADGTPTAEGAETIARLAKLTGLRKARLFEGKRVSAEGLVYDEVWDAQNGSVTDLAEYEPGAGMVLWAGDDGYSAGSAPEARGTNPETGFYVADSHPRVFLLCQLKSDGHLDVFAESYACLKLTDAHIAEVLELPYPRPEFVSYGPGAAEFRGRLFAASLVPHQCTAQVETSIQELRAWLGADVNGWRRVRVHPRCKQLCAEMLSYAYDPAGQKPIKQFDHGPDALRGLVWVLRNMFR